MASSRRVLLLYCTIASAICGVFCKWNYYSYTEALTDDNQLCLGECNAGECVTDWWDETKPCHSQNEETKHYVSLNNYPCQSNCGKFDKESYEWCVVDINEWDYCNRRLALKGKYKHTTHNEYVTCSGECGPQGESYDWCTTVTRWEKCNVDEIIFVPDYPTVEKTRCETSCKKYDSDRKSYCYDTNGDWVRCFLNPQYEHVLHSITHKLRTTCKNKKKFGNYTSNGYRSCTNTWSKSKRDSSNGDFSFDACDLNVSSVAEQHRANNPTDQVRTIRPHRPITTNPDPILSYTLMPRRVRFGARGTARDLDLPLVVEAQLTTYTLVPPGGRERFVTDVTNHFRLMNPNGRGTTLDDNYDERGHIVGSRVGGPMAPFNIIPQTWRLNRGSGSSWFQMEQHMEAFLQGRDDRYIEFLAVIGYLSDRNGRLITRPDHIGVRLRFHQDNIWTDRHGNRIDRPEDNETEDMFFSNNPEDDCNVDLLW